MAVKKLPRNRVLLVARDKEGEVVERASLSCEDYYDASHPILDEPARRRKNGIRTVIGEVYDARGRLDQRFENRYNARGTCVGSSTVYRDGTTIED